MPKEHSKKASLPSLIGSSRGLIRGSDASTIFESRLQLAKDSDENSTQSHASITKKEATNLIITTQVQPAPFPTSSNSRNSSRTCRSSVSLAVPSDLTDSQILDLWSTDEDDEGDKDDENNDDDERKKEHTGKMPLGNICWRNQNLFPARKMGDPDYDRDPRHFNRRFEEKARAAKRAEEEAVKRAEEDAAKRADELLAFEMVLAKEHLKIQRSHAKELSATHSWPAKTKLYFCTTFASSKKSKEPTKEAIQSAKTWPARNMFTAKKKVEGLESHLASKDEVFRGLVRGFTFGSRHP